MGLKIIYISHTAEYAGAEASLFNLLKYAVAQDYLIPLVVLPYEGPLLHKLNSIGVDCYICPYPWWVMCAGQTVPPSESLRPNIQSLVDLIHNFGAQLVHTNTSVVWEGALAAKLAGIPHVWHIHEILEAHPGLQPVLPLFLFYQIIEFLSDRVVTVSNTLQDSLVKYIPLDKLITIYNGVDDTQALDDGKLFRNEICAKVKDIVIAVVGSLRIEKGQHLLLDVVSSTSLHKLPLKYVFIGDGHQEYVNYLKQRADELGISDYVVFTGYRNDIPDVLAAVDLVVIPSVTESFSLVAVEAMRAGKAVVSTMCGGPSEIIVDGKTGYLVPLNDANSMADRIIELASDSNKRYKMGQEGIERYRKKFTVEIYTGNFVALYQDIIEKRPQKSISERDIMCADAYIETYMAVHKSKWQEQVINALLSSLSWRVTAPLRFAHKQFCKLINGEANC